MHVLCAPDSFKESIRADQAAQAMAQGILKALPGATCDICPIADGGEATLDILITALNGEIHEREVLGPLGDAGKPIMARFGMVESMGLGIVELAEASGLALLEPDQRIPMRTTTYGTGQLLRAVIDMGAQEMILGLGGSATNDGGVGIAQALGVTFIDHTGIEIKSPIVGADLRSIDHFDSKVDLPRIHVACDVTNPLTGPNGASAIYGPQKGATRQQVEQLDAGLLHLATLSNVDPNQPGTGAAGGAGFGLAAFCGATLKPGIDLVLETLDFESRCVKADLVLTGEGTLDHQSRQGKACLGVARIAKQLGIPCIALVGQAGDGAEACCDPDRPDSLTRYVSLSEVFGMNRAMNDPADCLSKAAGEMALEYR
ncbi:MAG: glycerate kinase [Planctomycetota bacterium]|nr:glycerate kinase [Planctomycetota bacterium]